MKSTCQFLNCLFLAVATAISAHAQSVVTDPVGFITLTVKPINTTYPANNPTGLNFISLGMPRPVAYQSLVPTGSGLGASTVGNTTTITFAPSTFTAGQFGSGGAFYLEILNGTDAGKTADITSTTTNSLVLDTNLTSSITNGTTTFRIRPYWTLATAFGATNTAGFQGGASLGNVATADLIQTVSRIDGTVTSYFFNNASGVNQWQNASSGADASNLSIDPDEGLQVLRRGAGDLSFKLAGDVKTGNTEILLARRSGFDAINVVANPYAVESVLLKDSGLQNIVVGGTPNTSGLSTTADTVRIHDLTRNTFNDYFYDTNALKWKSGFTDASLAFIPSGSSVQITRKSNSTSTVSWFAPQPSMVLADVPLTLSFVSAVSRKNHTGYGDFDINLPTSGASATESRKSSLQTHTIVIKFNKPIVNGSAALVSGVASTPISSSITDKELTLNLTGVNDTQKLVLSVSGISDTDGQSLSSFSVPIRFLTGDINNSGSVSVADQQNVKNYVLQNLTLANIRADANKSSSAISVSDQQEVRNNILKSVSDL